MSSETRSITDEAELAGPDAGVHASISVPAAPARVWQHLISQPGTEALLGDGVRLGGKGESWHASDGSYGVVRSYHPTEQLRVTWHPQEDGPVSMLDLHLLPEGDATRVDLVHLGQGATVSQRHWQEALDRVATTLPD